MEVTFARAECVRCWPEEWLYCSLFILTTSRVISWLLLLKPVSYSAPSGQTSRREFYSDSERQKFKVVATMGHPDIGRYNRNIAMEKFVASNFDFIFHISYFYCKKSWVQFWNFLQNFALGFWLNVFRMFFYQFNPVSVMPRHCYPFLKWCPVNFVLSGDFFYIFKMKF